MKIAHVIQKYLALFGAGLIGSVRHEFRGKSKIGGIAPTCSSEDRESDHINSSLIHNVVSNASVLLLLSKLKKFDICMVNFIFRF